MSPSGSPPRVTSVNAALKLNERTENMKMIVLLLLFTQTLIASTFREQTIDLGKGQSLVLVNLKHEFWVSKYETTQGQWLAVMGQPSPGSPLSCLIYDKRQRGDRRPMCHIGLVHAEAFCKAASEKTGRKIRLPTELEWEFFANGTKLEDAVCSIGLNPGLQAPADVGSKGPNRFGLYDVLGNALEICSGNWEDYFDKRLGRKRKDTPTCMGGSAPWTPMRGGFYATNGQIMMKIGFRDWSIGKGMAIGGGGGFRVVCDGDGK